MSASTTIVGDTVVHETPPLDIAAAANASASVGVTSAVPDVDVRQAGSMYTRLTDEIRHANETMRDKRKSLMQREAEIIGSMGNAANGEELHTDDGRVLILTQKNKRPSLAKKEFLSRGLEMFWNRLTSTEHESMSGSVFAARQLAFLKELQDAAEVHVPVIKEKGGASSRKKRKRSTATTDGTSFLQLLL